MHTTLLYINIIYIHSTTRVPISPHGEKIEETRALENEKSMWPVAPVPSCQLREFKQKKTERKTGIAATRKTFGGPCLKAATAQGGSLSLSRPSPLRLGGLDGGIARLDL